MGLSIETLIETSVGGFLIVVPDDPVRVYLKDTLGGDRPWDSEYTRLLKS